MGANCCLLPLIAAYCRSCKLRKIWSREKGSLCVVFNLAGVSLSRCGTPSGLELLPGALDMCGPLAVVPHGGSVQCSLLDWAEAAANL